MNIGYYEWGDLQELEKRILLDMVPELSEASAIYGGPFVVVTKGAKLPEPLDKRLLDTHDRSASITINDFQIHIWYHVVGVTL